MTTRAAVSTQQSTPLDLRIEALAVAGTAHGLAGLALTDYVVAQCLDLLRHHVTERVGSLRAVGRLDLPDQSSALHGASTPSK